MLYNCSFLLSKKQLAAFATGVYLGKWSVSDPFNYAERDIYQLFMWVNNICLSYLCVIWQTDKRIVRERASQ